MPTPLSQISFAGETEDERFLLALARQSFLSFWCWPNLFRDQGGKSCGDGKEICDLLVVFDDDVLIFSDKRIKFSDGVDPGVAWRRWARKALGGSIKQIRGAKRWLEEYPERVFLDKACQHRLPIPLPPAERRRFHQILVCHGVEEVIESPDPVERSLRLDNRLRGASHWKDEGSPSLTVGHVDEEAFVHVFNENSLGLVLGLFDTASDFIGYLKQRERLLSLEQTVTATCESDLIHLFFDSYCPDAESYDLVAGAGGEGADDIQLDYGGAVGILTHPQLIAKREADARGALWDGIIECLSYHVKNESTHHRNWDSPAEIHPILTELAKETRFSRRVLSDSIVAFFNKCGRLTKGTRTLISPIRKGVAYIFLLLVDVHAASDAKYREARLALLADHCSILMAKNEAVDAVIGLAARPSDRTLTPRYYNAFISEGIDFTYLPRDTYTEEDRIQALELEEYYVKGGVISPQERIEFQTKDLPDV